MKKKEPKVVKKEINVNEVLEDIISGTAKQVGMQVFIPSANERIAAIKLKLSLDAMEKAKNESDEEKKFGFYLP